MKIILIVDGQLDTKVINELVAEIQSNEPKIEINQFPVAQKSFIPFDKVMIFVGKAIGTLIVQSLVKAGVKWAKDRIDYEGDNSRPKFIQIFGADGIPLAGTRVLTTGEIEEIPVEKIGKMAPMPPHLL